MTNKRRLAEDMKADVTQLHSVEPSKKRIQHSPNVSGDKCSSDDTNIKVSKEERQLQKAQRKEEKAKLLEKIPKLDSNGIAYTKIQIRRMMRRLKKGLQPVPTEEEEREMKRQRKRDKQIEEAELVGIFYDRKPIDHRSDDNETEEEDSDAGHDEEENENHSDKEVDLDMSKEADKPKHYLQEVSHEMDDTSSKTFLPQKGRSKPVPPNYVCQACQNKHSPVHWIYNCPDKVHRPGCNQLSKKDRGINIPSARKLFVSGLPFDWKHKDVVEFFRKECDATVVHCKLLMFEDTKRCKGQAFVTFDKEESAKKGLKLHGKALESFKMKQDGSNRKELTLGITKVQNRRK